MILSNSPGLGSRGIFTDWAMHTPPAIKSNTDLILDLSVNTILLILTFNQIFQ